MSEDQPMTAPDLPDPRHVPHRFMEPCGSQEGKDSCWWCALSKAKHPQVYADAAPRAVTEPVEPSAGLREALYDLFDSESFMLAHLNARSLTMAVLDDPRVRAALTANLEAAWEEHRNRDHDALDYEGCGPSCADGIWGAALSVHPRIQVERGGPWPT